MHQFRNLEFGAILILKMDKEICKGMLLAQNIEHQKENLKIAERLETISKAAAAGGSLVVAGMILKIVFELKKVEL